MASILSWLNSASSSHAAFARFARSRASAMDVRSRLEGAAAASAILGILREDLLDFRVRSRDDVDRYQLANATRSCRAGIGCDFDRADIATHHDSDVPGADVFLGDQRDIGSFHHRVGRLDGPDQAFRFDES